MSKLRQGIPTLGTDSIQTVRIKKYEPAMAWRHCSQRKSRRDMTSDPNDIAGRCFISLQRNLVYMTGVGMRSKSRSQKTCGDCEADDLWD